MRRNIFQKKLYVAFFISFAFIIGFTPSAHAEPAEVSITLSPASNRMKFEPGRNYPGELTVINDGKEDYDFNIYTAPYSMNTETYDKPDFLTQKPNSDLFKWLTISKKKYHIASGASVKVSYTLSIPKKASPGGHYGVIFAQIEPTQAENEVMAASQVKRIKRVGTIFYATVNGDYILKGEFGATRIPFWQRDAPLRVSQQVKNTGNADFDTTYKMVIEDIFGNKKFTNEKTFIVLPQTTRLVSLEWSQSVWYGLYKVKAETTFLDKKLHKEQYVLLLPIWMVFVAVVVLAGASFGVYKRYFS